MKIVEMWEKQKFTYQQSLNDFIDGKIKEGEKKDYDWLDLRYDDLITLLIKDIFSEISEYGIYGYGVVNDKIQFHRIDDGDYQGTIIYMIPKGDYQPYDYILTKVSYGSCSGCDTLQGVEYDYRDNGDKDELISELMTLSLHIIQRSKFV